MKPERLSGVERKVLQSLAREALDGAVKTGAIPPLPQGLPISLLEMGASFVTLTHQGKLRGCIGVIEPFRPLAEDVRENTMGAAFFDPRFPKVQDDELEGMAIEIAILSPLKRVEYQEVGKLVEVLRPGVDGVLVKIEEKRATFLPKVWDKIPDPQLFLGMLCRKMGVPEDTWQLQPLEVYVYQTEEICD